MPIQDTSLFKTKQFQPEAGQSLVFPSVALKMTVGPSDAQLQQKSLLRYRPSIVVYR